MNTRTSRSLTGVLFHKTTQTNDLQEGPTSGDELQLIEAYVQQSRSTSDAFGTLFSDPDAFEAGFTSKGDGGTPPKDFSYAGGDDPKSDVGTVFAIPNPQLIEGDGGDNTLEGSGVDNEIYGFGGNDTIFGNGGVDTVWGGDGEDEIFGGDDGDYLMGGEDDDDLHGEEGNDFLSGGGGNDNLFGGPGDDIIQGDAGNDTAFGGAGDDTFFDNSGNDTYTGGEGADTFAFYEINFWAGPGGGEDLILDFELGVDTLKIGQFAVGPYADLTFNEYIDQFASGGGEAGVVIEWVNGLIRLPGIDKEDLNPWDVELIG